MKRTDESELNQIKTMQNSEPDEDDDFDKRMRSVTTLPRIPKRKQVVESSTSGDAESEGKMLQKSVLDRIDRSNERGYGGQEAKWPKSQKMSDDKEGKPKSFGNDRFSNRGDSKSRPWEDNRNESDRRRHENRANFERVNEDRKISDRSEASGRSMGNRHKYVKTAEQKEKARLTEDERWAACLNLPDSKKGRTDSSDIADKSKDKDNSQNNKIGNNNALKQDSYNKHRRSESEKTDSKSSSKNLKTSSGRHDNHDIDAPKLVKNVNEKKCLSDDSEHAQVTIQDKPDKVDSPLPSMLSDLRPSKGMHDSPITSKTLIVPQVSSANRHCSQANITPSSTGTGESSPTTTYFASKDTEEFNRRQFDAEWQNLFPDDDASPGFPNFGADARILSANDYYNNSNTASPSGIISGTSSSVKFPMRTFNQVSQSTVMPHSDAFTAQSDPSPDTVSPLVEIAPTGTDASMEVIDMDVSSLSSNDQECVNEDSSPMLRVSDKSKVSHRSLEKSGNKVVSFTGPVKGDARKSDLTKDNGRTVAGKKNVQTRVVEELKMLLRPHYEKRKITKDDYKEIMRRAVHRICHGHTTDVPQDRIHSYANIYIAKVLKRRKSKSTRKSGSSDPPPPPPPSSNTVPSALLSAPLSSVPLPAALLARLSDASPPPPPPPTLPLFVPPVPPPQSFTPPVPPPPPPAAPPLASSQQRPWNPPGPALPVQPPITAVTYLSNIPLPMYAGSLPYLISLPPQQLVTTGSLVGSNGSTVNSTKSRSTL